MPEDLRTLLNRNRGNNARELANEPGIGVDAVEEELWEMAENDMADIALHGAVAMDIKDLIKYAARVVLCSGGYSKEDKDLAKQYVTL